MGTGNQSRVLCKSIEAASVPNCRAICRLVVMFCLYMVAEITPFSFLSVALGIEPRIPCVSEKCSMGEFLAAALVSFQGH